MQQPMHEASGGRAQVDEEEAAVRRQVVLVGLERDLEDTGVPCSSARMDDVVAGANVDVHGCQLGEDGGSVGERQDAFELVGSNDRRVHAR